MQFVRCLGCSVFITVQQKRLADGNYELRGMMIEYCRSRSEVVYEIIRPVGASATEADLVQLKQIVLADLRETAFEMYEMPMVEE